MMSPYDRFNRMLSYIPLVVILLMCGIYVPNIAYGLSDVDAIDAVVHGKMNSTSVTSPEMKAIAISIGAVGVLANGIIVLVLIHSAPLRQKTTKKFILHQSSIDLVAGLILIFTHIFEDVNWVPPGISADIFCRLWTSKYFLWSAFMASTWNLVFLTLERYISICHPKCYGRLFTRLGIAMLCLAAWVIGLAWLSFLGVAGTKMEGITCMPYAWAHINEQGTKAVISIHIIISFVVPIVIFVTCYSRIVYFLYNVKLGDVDIIKERRISSGIINMISTTGAIANLDNTLASLHINVNQPTELSHVKVNTIRTLIIVVIGFIICWTPSEVYFTLFSLGYDCCSLSSPVYHVTGVLVFCNTIINPFIYAIQFRDFQIGAKQLCCSLVYAQDEAIVHVTRL